MQAAPALQPRPAMTGPLLRGAGELHIVDTHDVTSIADPDGVMHRLVALADGSRSETELFGALVREYPHLDEGDVAAAIFCLTCAGVLEDCGRGRDRRRRRARITAHSPDRRACRAGRCAAAESRSLAARHPAFVCFGAGSGQPGMPGGPTMSMP